MKRFWRASLLSLLSVAGILSAVGCTSESWDFERRWAAFSNDMRDLNRSIDYHVFNYDWYDPYLP